MVQLLKTCSGNVHPQDRPPCSFKQSASGRVLPAADLGPNVSQVTMIIALRLLACAMPKARPRFSAAGCPTFTKTIAFALAIVVTCLPNEVLGRSIRFSTSEVTFGSVDVSPDGKTIAFDLLGDIYSLPITGGNARAIITGPSFDTRPRWSPDGKSLAFISDRSGSENLWLFSLSNGETRNISREPAASALPMTTPAWSPDGNSIIVTTAERIPSPTRNLTLRLRAVSLNGGEPPGPLPQLRGSDPFVSPDGRFIYFSRSVEPLDVIRWTNDDTVLTGWQIARADRESGLVVNLTSAVEGAMAPTLSPNGRWMAYVTRRAGHSQLRIKDFLMGTDKALVEKIDRDQQETKLREGLAPSSSFTPDSRYLVTAIGGKLWRIESESGVRTEISFTASVELQVPEPTRSGASPVFQPMFKSRHIRRPSHSPNGLQIAFEAARKIWISDARGRGVRRLTSSDLGSEAAPSWSPDGKSILFTASTGDRSSAVYRQALKGKARPPKKLTKGPGAYAEPLADPSGEAIYYFWRSWDENLLYNGGNSAELRSLHLGTGKERTIGILSGNAEVRPQLVEGSPHVYVYDPSAGLIRITQGGSQRILFTAHFRRKQTDPREDYSKGLVASDILIAPTGRAAILRHHWDLYLAEFDRPMDSLDGMTLAVLSPPAGVKVTRLSMGGGLDPEWRQDQQVAYAIGSEIVSIHVGSQARTSAHIELTLAAATPPGAVLLRGARLVTMGSKGIIAAGDILLRGNRIAAIGPAGSFPLPPGAVILDVSGRTIVPGFVDTHCHPPPRPAGAPIVEQPYSLLNYLAYGVTTCFDPFGPLDGLTDRYLIETGEILGPRLFNVGGPIEWHNPVETAAGAMAVMERLATYDLFAVKEYMSGSSVVRGNIGEAARRKNMRTFFETVGFRHNLGNILKGYTDSAHSFPSPDVHDDVRQLLRRTGTSVHAQFLTLRDEGGPSAIFHFLDKYDLASDAKFRRFAPAALIKEKTLRRFHVDDREQVFADYARLMGSFAQDGIPVGLGGHGEILGLGYHWEVEALAAGSNPLVALTSATIGGARSLGMDAEIGSLEAGKLADLLVMNGDPLASIQDTQKMVWVVKNGVIYDSDTLREIRPSDRLAGAQ